MNANPVLESDVANWLEGTTHTVECAIGWFGLDIGTGDLIEMLQESGMRRCAACGWWWNESWDSEAGDDDDDDDDDDAGYDDEELTDLPLCFQCQDRE